MFASSGHGVPYWYWLRPGHSDSGNATYGVIRRSWLISLSSFTSMSSRHSDPNDSPWCGAATSMYLGEPGIARMPISVFGKADFAHGQPLPRLWLPCVLSANVCHGYG